MAGKFLKCKKLKSQGIINLKVKTPLRFLDFLGNQTESKKMKNKKKKHTEKKHDLQFQPQLFWSKIKKFPF